MTPDERYLLELEEDARRKRQEAEDFRKLANIQTSMGCWVFVVLMGVVGLFFMFVVFIALLEM